MKSIYFVLFFSFLLFCGSAEAQNCVYKGKIKDNENKPIEDVKIQIKSLSKATVSDAKGEFSLQLAPGKYKVLFNHVSFQSLSSEIQLAPGQKLNEYIVMTKKDVSLDQIDVTDVNKTTGIQSGDKAFMEIFPINPKKINEIPTPKSDIESRLTTLPGVSSNNEFTSQYRVRGGNFDENLIYVNDIEVYRPFLIRSGQQEGLGFTNANLVKDVSFSTGGFQAKYGDKLSSVLDLTYREPNKLKGTAEIGILTTNLHVEGSSKNKEDSTRAGRFTYLAGARRFSTRYLLGSLDSNGDYRPSFQDVQSLFTFTPKMYVPEYRIKTRADGTRDSTSLPQDRLKFSLLLTMARNIYEFTPQNRETSFGTVQNVLRLFVAFEGKEETGYLTGLGAFTIEHKPSYRLNFKYIISAFTTNESEVFDVEAGYRLSDVNTNIGGDNFNDATFDRSIGTYYQHARNYLTASVLSAEQKATWFADKAFKHKVNWGFRVQYQHVNDELKEWNAVDSSDYVTIKESFQSKTDFSSMRYIGYAQDNWKIAKNQRLILGARFNYNDLNSQLLFSPRIQYLINPQLKDSTKQFQIRFATGFYQQPPFYREMRRFDGTVNFDLKAQTSIHFIAGTDYSFHAWGRPFKLFTEAYYKYLTNLVPYDVDNVRIRYYGDNVAVGYAYGLDMKVNGEFLKGVDSWISAGLLKTMEDLSIDNKGYVSRPSDQRFTFAMYFQDEMPRNPTYKVHLNFVYASGLHFGPPNNIDNRTALTATPYRRVDIGFSKLISFKTREERGKFGLESLWISAEVFNLFQVPNVVSYLWIKDVYNTQFGIPNYLSQRLFNLRVIARF